ncbi:hypothetical protein, partial [Nonomuraea rosea]|uniref:hypothetical protein n=1 Tax=Nonomuraea rosea TaxID=638574 RepID=UPI0031E8D0AF
MNWLLCPGCEAVLPAGPLDACPGCRLLLRGPAADDYLAVSDMLALLDERRTELVRRRDEALASMRDATAAAALPSMASVAIAEPVGVATTAGATAAASVKVARRPPSRPVEDASAEAEAAAAAPGRDLSHRAVQNVLLLLGGVLLSIAAVVFTLVSWQVPALRALILSVFTLGVLAAPWLLVRRRLVATAETVALIGLVLIPLDGVAIRQVFDEGGPSAGPGLGPWWGCSLIAAAMTVAWAAYSLRAPLRLPAPVAIVLAQTPLPLAGLALASSSTLGSGWLAGALIATAAADLALWQAARRARAAAEYLTTAVAGSIAWLLGAGLAAYLAVTPGDMLAPFEAVVPSVALLLAGVPFAALVLGAASVVAAWWAAATRGRTRRLLIAAFAALAAVAGVWAVPASVVPGSWRPAVLAAVSCLLLAATLRLPVRLRDGLRTGGVLTLSAAASWKLYAVASAALAPLGWVTSIWQDVTGPAAELLGPGGVRWGDTAATPVVMAAVAAGLALVPPRGEVWTAGLRQRLCLGFGSLAVLTAPPALGMAYEVALGVLVALSGALLLTAARRPVPTIPPQAEPADPAAGARAEGGRTWTGNAALWVGGYLAVLVMCWALADRQATAVVAAGLLLPLAVCAVAAKDRAVQVAGGAGAVIAAGLLLWALLPTGLAAALALLGVRAATLVVTRPSRKLAAAVVRAPRTGRTLALGSLDRLTRVVRPGGRTAVEVAAMALAAFALTRPGLDSGRLALVLAIGAALAAASAWRRPKGPWRTTAVIEACVLAALAPLPLSQAVVPALIGPYGWLTHAWTGATGGAREALSPAAGAWPEQPLLLPVLILAGAAGAAAAWARWGRPAAMGVAMIVFPLVATTLPLVADLPYWAALVFLVALTAGLALWSAVSRSAAGSASLWTATLAVSWSLADRTATLAVLAAIVVTGLLCAFRGKGSPVTSVASTVTGLAIGAESVAAALGGGLGRANAALVLLLVAVLLSRAAALPVLRAAVAGPVGGTALALWTVAAMLSGDVARLSLVLAVGGLALAGAAGRLREVPRSGAHLVAGLAAGLALLPHLPVWFEVVSRPYAHLLRPWSERYQGQAAVSGPAGAPLLVDAGFEVTGAVTALGVGVFVAVAGVLIARGTRGAAAARAAAVLAVPGCLVLVPAVAGLAYPWLLAFYGVVLVALAVQAAVLPRAGVAGAVAVGFGAHLVVWALDVASYTLVVLAGVAVLGLAAGVGG